MEQSSFYHCTCMYVVQLVVQCTVHCSVHCTTRWDPCIDVVSLYTVLYTVHNGPTSGPKTKNLNFSKIAANRLKIAARPSCPWKYNPNPPQANTDWAIHVRSWGVWHFRGDIAGNREMRENILLNVSNFWVHYNDKGMDWDMRQTRNALFNPFIPGGGLRKPRGS